MSDFEIVMPLFVKVHTWSKITVFYLDTMVTDCSKHGLHINHILARNYSHSLYGWTDVTGANNLEYLLQY